MPLSTYDAVIVEAVNRLVSASNRDLTYDAAQMQLINLPEIIKSTGPQWPRVKDKIRTGSMAFLRGCLADDDIVIPAGDGFLIIFGEAAPPDALKLKAEEMRNLLLEYYLGEEELRRLRITVACQQVTPQDLGALVAPPAKPVVSNEATHSILFAPVWTAPSSMVASYMCTPVRNDARGVRYGYDDGYLFSGTNEHRDYLELDLSLIEKAANAVSSFKSEGSHPAIGITVHSTTMHNRTARAAYLDRLSKIPARDRKHVYIKVAEVDPGVPLIHLADWAGMLRAHVRNILIEHHASENAPSDLSQVGVGGAGFRAPAEFNRESTDITPFARALGVWGAGLRRQRLRFFVDDLRRGDLIRLAVRAGARFITSDVYWPFRPDPGPIFEAQAPSILHFPDTPNQLSSPQG